MSSSRLHVIFDVDGVLVDSSDAHYESWVALADECRCHRMTRDEFLATFGRTSREILRELWTGRPLAASEIAELDARKEALFREILRADFRPIAGVRELIVSLKRRGFGLAVGSSGPPENVWLTIDQLGVRDYFDAVVTGMDVTRGKPDPEVFLTCAARMGAPHWSCAVIEDAVVGVDAANGAGMYSIALVSPARDTRLFPHAGRVVRELRELTADAIRQALEARQPDASPEE